LPGESWARVLFVSMGLPSVELQVEIRDERGRFVARVDFLFPQARTVVEFDGVAISALRGSLGSVPHFVRLGRC
jgi:hypothetical protein